MQTTDPTNAPRDFFLPSPKGLGLFLGPLLFIIMLLVPIPSAISKEGWWVIATLVLMLTWWILESVPLAITALLPLIVFPLFGVSTFAKASQVYADPIVFLFMGGFLLALGVEKWHLHKRIALNILRITGGSLDKIVLGFMIATAFLSMWISNTATTIMMLPIALSVIDWLFSNNQDSFSEVEQRNFKLKLLLSISYCASIGGMATIIGTPPNTVMAGYLARNLSIEVGFAEWFAFGFPLSVLLLWGCYMMMTKVLFVNKAVLTQTPEVMIKKSLQGLGKMTNGERVVSVVFLLTASLWVTKGLINDWLSIGLTDSAIAIIGGSLLFIYPLSIRTDRFVLKWEDTQKMPWGILIFFGGGLALADALETSGLITLVGNQFAGTSLSYFMLLTILCTITIYLSEIMSNVALVTVFLPVVAGIAAANGFDALGLIVPVTVSGSCSFMLPMSTPPNTIVFASGHVNIMQMVRAGFLLNIIAVFVVVLVGYYVVGLIF